MKKLKFLAIPIALAAAGVAWLLNKAAGPVAGFLGMMIFLLGVFYLIDWIAAMIKARQYGNRYENIYVVENPPDCDLEKMLPALRVQGLIIAVSKGKVLETALAERELLKKAGNKRGVEVIPIHFQSGMYVNETVEEYIERLTDLIKVNRSIRHNDIKEKDPDWYERTHHGEKVRNVYEWNGKKS